MTSILTPTRHDFRRPTWWAAFLALIVISFPPVSRAQDTTPPTVNSVTVANDGYSIEVQFSEPMELNSAADPFNYLVDESFGPDWVIVWFSQYAVDLFFNAPIQPGMHQLSIWALVDLSGNALAEPTVIPFTWDPPVLTSAVANCSGTELTATFSAPVDPNPGADVFLYHVVDENGDWIDSVYFIGAVLHPDNQTVTLMLDEYSPLLPGQSYGLLTEMITGPNGEMYSWFQTVPVQFAPIPPVVACRVTVNRLSPVNNQLVDVGFSATSSEPDVQIQVFSDEPEVATLQDATLADGVLKLRARRDPGSDGRVYLIVVTSIDACGDVGVCCSSVVISKNGGAAALASVQAQAEAAQAQCSAAGSPLTPYRIFP